VRCERDHRGRFPTPATASASPRPGAAFAPRRLSADAGLLSSILDTLDELDRRRLRQRRAAAVMAAAGAAVLASRSRRGRGGR
jgi:hypothetical protein